MKPGSSEVATIAGRSLRGQQPRGNPALQVTGSHRWRHIGIQSVIACSHPAVEEDLEDRVRQPRLETDIDKQVIDRSKKLSFNARSHVERSDLAQLSTHVRENKRSDVDTWVEAFAEAAEHSVVVTSMTSPPFFQ